jgi:hypothetical protein
MNFFNSIVISFALLFPCALVAQSLNSEQQKAISEVVNNASKRDCINFWSASKEVTDSLYKIGSSVAEQCQCVNSEMDYLLTIEEKMSIAVAFSIFGKADGNKSEMDSATNTLNAWQSKNRSLIRSCFLKFSTQGK